MYRIYDTEAIVFSSSPKSEGSRELRLLTRDFGLITVHAEGLRKSLSKFRFALQTFSVAEVSLVRGRGVYRVIGASSLFSFREVFGGSFERRFVLGRIFKLLGRMLPEEGRNLRVYEHTLELVRSSVRASAEELPLLEMVVVVRLLHALGYFPRKEPYEALFEGELARVLPLATSLRRFLVADINQAISGSHL